MSRRNFFVGNFRGLFPKNLRQASVVWNDDVVAAIKHNEDINNKIRAEQDRIIQSDRVCYFYYRMSLSLNEAMRIIREQLGDGLPLSKEDFSELYRLQEQFNYYWDKFMERQMELDFSSVQALINERIPL